MENLVTEIVINVYFYFEFNMHDANKILRRETENKRIDKQNKQKQTFYKINVVGKKPIASKNIY